MPEPTRAALCLLILTDLSLSAGAVTAIVGGAVTLPCGYSLDGGTTSMCWGRGQCPNSKCSSAIIWTDGRSVTWRESDKYQLLGEVEEGNVTLTITAVTPEDAGNYCCRVEIPGIFNDQKTEMTVEIREDILIVSPSPSTVSATTKGTGSYHPVVLAVVALVIALPILFGFLIYRNRHLEKQISSLSSVCPESEDPGSCSSRGEHI
ncbi:hepatitis A virus cellular receptor 1 homolog isoform X2 [Dendropsophus ebraccatus]|uniref:hepatitis A virus cellular receptor 1 homolog isoform X2 n=1 Tax=Dendropsophus ebraccatus TaxID=150705 RepID=UPI0038310B1A